MSEPHEVIKKALAKRGTKTVAAEMGLSEALVYKWGQDSENGSGTTNPLERILALTETSGDESIVDWLCLKLGSFRIKNNLESAEISETVPKTLQTIIKEFSDLLSATTQTYAEGSDISPAESAQIREEWEELKTIGETFVFACENGMFCPPPEPEKNKPKPGM